MGQKSRKFTDLIRDTINGTKWRNMITNSLRKLSNDWMNLDVYDFVEGINLLNLYFWWFNIKNKIKLENINGDLKLYKEVLLWLVFRIWTYCTGWIMWDRRTGIMNRSSDGRVTADCREKLFTILKQWIFI